MDTALGKIETPLVSIVIPTYNHASCLPNAIHSCLNQTHKHLEIIVIDDGSTDNTQEMAREFKDKIIYIYQDNRGVSAARNAGLELATGDFITFLDADDYLTEDSIEVRLKVLLQYDDIGFVMGETYSKYVSQNTIVYKPKLKGILISDKFYEDLLLKRITFGPSLIRSSLAKRFRFPVHITNGEDIAYSTKILFSAKGYFLPKPVAVISRHMGGQHRDSEKMIKQGVDLISTILDDPYYEGGLEYLRKDFTSSRYLSLFRSLYLSGDFRLAKKYYISAISVKPTSIIKLRYLTKFIRACLRGTMK
jgi:glycosyltransferase involved in cell wall biosynthesis